jgi:hypothetical protein
LDETPAAGRISMIGLSYGEHLIVWGLRRVVAAHGPDGQLLDECHAAFSDDGDEAMRALCLFLCLLGRAARRPIQIGTPGTLAVTWDEGRILTFLAAAQRWAEGDGPARVDAHLQWLAPPAHRPALAQVSLALGNLLAAHGHFFSLPADAPAITGAWPAAQPRRRLN